jgi:phosphomannomutase
MSNTEQIFRIISEASSQKEAQKLIDNILNVIK